MPLGRLSVGRLESPLPCPALGCQRPRRLTTTPRNASSKIEFSSVERSVPRREANTVNRRSFSGVKRSEHFRRSAALPLVVFARRRSLALGIPCVLAHRLCPPLVASVGSIPKEISAKGGWRLGANAPRAVEAGYQPAPPWSLVLSCWATRRGVTAVLLKRYQYRRNITAVEFLPIN